MPFCVDKKLSFPRRRESSECYRLAMSFSKPKKLIGSMTWNAAAGRSFLLFAQKKRTKEKGTPCVGLRLHCVAFFVRETHQTRCAQTGKSLILTKSRYSPTQKGNLGMAVGWAE
jgi:hypothetical protein